MQRSSAGGTPSAILVTGGAGYIGSHTCKYLAALGHTPVVIDNLSTGHRRNVKWGPLIQGDVADQRLVQEALRDYRISAVIHFAANALVGESMKNPRDYLHGNVNTSLALLDAMRAAGVTEIVLASTCAVYGVPRRIPISERMPLAPANPYGESKLFVERALHWYERAHGLRWVALRYFNAAGADPEGELGECRSHETHLIPLAIEAALGLRSSIRIMGTDYATPDGTAIRDYIHVEDLARAHVSALKYLGRGLSSVALNLGMEHGYSVREVIASVERTGGRPVPVEESARRGGDPPALVADSRRARKILAWKPRYTNLDAIVSTAWRWHASQAVSAGVQAENHASMRPKLSDGQRGSTGPALVPPVPVRGDRDGPRLVSAPIRGQR